jgi:hypothetical protein
VFFKFDDEVTLLREGRQINIRAYVQSADAVFAKYDADVEEGDTFNSEAIPGDYYVNKIKRIRGPRGRHDDMNHCRIYLMTKKEWERLHKPVEPSVSQTFNIGSAAAVAGHDVVGQCSFNITSVQGLFAELERRIVEDPTIGEEEKKTMLAKVRDFVLTPRLGEFLGGVLKGWSG